MTDMKFIDALLIKKLIRPETYSPEVIHRHLVRARQDIQTALRNMQFDDEIAYSIAYQAMLRTGRALMFSFGYRPIDGQQHVTVVKFAEYVLGKQAENLIDSFERMRRQRHSFWYESIEVISRNDASTAIKRAELLVELVEKFVSQDNTKRG